MQVVRAVVGDVEDRVLVDVVVPGVARAHVEDVLEAAALPGGAGELGQVTGDEIAGRQQAASGEHAAEDGSQRFRAGHEQVRVGLAHAVEVALRDDAAVLDHEEAVREGLGQHVRERQPAPCVLELEGVELALGARELPHRALAARDRRGPAQLGHVAEAPAVVGRVEPVGGGDPERTAFRIDHESSLRSARLPRRRSVAAQVA